MSEQPSFIDPAYIAVRCDLTIDDVQTTAAKLVHRELWSNNPAARVLVEKELRFAVAEQIVDKLAPPVFEVRPDSLRTEVPISRAEALRLAQVHTKALAELTARLQSAGENYAVLAAERAALAGQVLVEKLEGHEGRLPERPASSEETTT